MCICTRVHVNVMTQSLSSFVCPQELDQNTLEQVSASVKAGQLLAVIGPVGAGKVRNCESFCVVPPKIEHLGDSICMDTDTDMATVKIHKV